MQKPSSQPPGPESRVLVVSAIVIKPIKRANNRTDRRCGVLSVRSAFGMSQIAIHRNRSLANHVVVDGHGVRYLSFTS
jgi:hypothetical protein